MRENHEGCSNHLHPLAFGIASAVAIGVLVYLLNHEPMLALPSIKGEKLSSEQMVLRIAAADVAKETIGYLTSLTIALAAVAGFLLKDGLGKGLWKSLNLVLSPLVSYFLIKSLLLAYDAYGMIAIQLTEGYFLVSRVQEVISAQAQKLLIALVLTTGLVTARIH